MKSLRILLFLTIIGSAVVLFQHCRSGKVEPKWPSISRETKPWTRWWWHGSALTREGISAEMEAYQKAGIGGLEITPIYGVMGYEQQFVDFLSPQWMELLLHTLREAERLDMGIDMATGTGWPFGGPWVRDEDACKDMNYVIYEVKGGKRLAEKVEFIQPPYLRAIGNPIFREDGSMRLDPKKIDIKQLKQPVGTNKDLQSLALEQVKFEKRLALHVLMAYGEKGEVLNLTDKVSPAGELNWTAPDGQWKLYAVFEGWHGKMVERAGPGGEGNVIDHFSSTALNNYLNHFDSAFSGKDIRSLRSFFNDSYEVDDARGTADWTPTLFDEFNKLKGYDLREHLPELLDTAAVTNRRVLCDYRETISELLLNNFTRPWVSWSHRQSAMVRNQAHGSPSNILDLYATVDIPEIEGTEPLRIKMASSAGNVTGKKLISSESATWLNEHFESTLAEVKVALDRFMLNGVNHIFYHGTSYSPPGESWPGWLFYAAVHFNPRNPMWNDFDALNTYVARCQSFLQNSQPDNDVLLYYPVYDRFSTPGIELIEHFDGIGRQFKNTAFERGAESMMKHGYAFDYISDKQIENTQWKDERLKTDGNSTYKTLVVPHGRFIPLRTFQKLISLAEAGATIIALEGLPDSTAGFNNHLVQETELQSGKKALLAGSQEKESRIIEMKVGKGRFLMADSLDRILAFASIRRESMVDGGIQFVRKKLSDNESLYFVSNTSGKDFEGWLPLKADAETFILFDPMDGGKGALQHRVKDDGAEVFVRLTKEQSILIQCINERVESTPYEYFSPHGVPISLNGQWKITFTSGGPELPTEITTDSLISWTAFNGPEFTSFSGTASYVTKFQKPPGEVKYWQLDLGEVKESAEIGLNGNSIGTLLGPSWHMVIPATLLHENNLLEVRVTNSMANRIIDLEKNKVLWKKYYNVNFPARKAENRINGLFDASSWKPRDSGLLGPVRLIPVGH